MLIAAWRALVDTVLVVVLVTLMLSVGRGVCDVFVDESGWLDSAARR